MFDFISAEPLQSESFRECIDRQVGIELGLKSADILVSNMAQLNLECAAKLSGDTDPSHLGVAFYVVHLYSKASRQKAESLSPNEYEWLASEELLCGKTSRGKLVSPILSFLLRRSQVIQSWQ